MARRTKIVATIGPASQDEQTLADMMRAGMDVARISLAHTPLPEAIERHRRVRAVAADLGVNIATMIDLPGSKIRIGQIELAGIDLEAGSAVELITGDGVSTHEQLPIDDPAVLADCQVGDEIGFAGCSVLIEIETKHSDTSATARVVIGGLLSGRPGIFTQYGWNDRPESNVDRDLCAAFADEDVDMVAVSATSAKELRNLGLEPHPRGPMVIAKVDTMAAVEGLAEIIDEAAGILVARGGLGLESPLEELPHLQKRITRECISGGLPVITAGQMLDSMVTAPSPTRAEATDIANAVFDGTSAVMLSAETAVGAQPASVVSTMARIAETADDRFDHVEWGNQVAKLRMAGQETSATAITDALTIAAAQAAEAMNLKALICVSESGFTVRSMARFRPGTTILGFSSNEKTVRQLASSWGVTPCLLEGAPSDYLVRVRVALNLSKRGGHVAAGDLVAVVAGISEAAKATDTLRLVRVP